MSDELKPCPFCGGENVTNEFDDPFYFVICGICGASSAFSDEEGAVRLWNARAAVTDEQFAMAVHEWALARMEGCDEPEWSMYSGIVDAIGRHRAASAKVVG